MWVQYIVWLVGNDWMKIDLDGDGVGEAYGTRKGVLRGDLGTSFVTRQPVLEMIGERLPNTLMLMLTTELVTICRLADHRLDLRAASSIPFYDHAVSAAVVRRLFHAHPSAVLGADLPLRRHPQADGLAVSAHRRHVRPRGGPGLLQTLWHMVLPVTTPIGRLHRRLQSLHSLDLS